MSGRPLGLPSVGTVTLVENRTLPSTQDGLRTRTGTTGVAVRVRTGGRRLVRSVAQGRIVETVVRHEGSRRHTRTFPIPKLLRISPRERTY